MRALDHSAIRDLPLFQDMEAENYQTLLRGGYVQNFPPQIDIIIEGDPADFLHIVVDGSVELYAGWSERNTTMAVLHPYSTFILAAAVKDARNLMSARTIEKSKLVLLPADDVRRMFDTDTNFARAVVSELASCYRDVIKHTKNLKLRSSVERLANYLLRQQILAEGATVFDLRIEKRRLASFLGMTPENLSRSIKALRPFGVSIDGQSVVIEPNAKLNKLAKPSLLIDDPIS